MFALVDLKFNVSSYNCTGSSKLDCRDGGEGKKGSKGRREEGEESYFVMF